MFQDIMEYASPADLLLLAETDPAKREQLEAAKAAKDSAKDRERDGAKDSEKETEHEKTRSEASLNRAKTAQTYALFFLLIILIVLVLILLGRGEDPATLIPHLT